MLKSKLIGLKFSLATYVLAAVGTFVVSYVVSVILARRIKKIDMVSSLKADE